MTSSSGQLPAGGRAVAWLGAAATVGRMSIDVIDAPAQVAWERVRAQFAPGDVILHSGSARLLSELYHGGMSFETMFAANPACPADVITAIATGEDAYDAVAAAQHRSCPPDVAVQAFRHLLADSSPLSSLMFAPAEALDIAVELGSRLVGFHRMLIGALAAVGNNGLVGEFAPPSVRTWLEGRSPSAIAALCSFDRYDQTALLAGRADLSEDELVSYAARLAERADSDRAIVAFLRQHDPLPLPAAERVMHQASTFRYWRAGRMLVQLLGRRPVDQQRQLLRLAHQLDALPPAVLIEVWHRAPIAPELLGTLTDLSAPLVAEGPPWAQLWSRDGQLSAPLGRMLGQLSAPLALWDLDEAALAVFVQLAPRWRGTLGQLIDVAVRSS